MKVRKFAKMAEEAKAKPHIGQVFHGNSPPNLSSSGGPALHKLKSHNAEHNNTGTNLTVER